jgi:hypothetical protein
LLTLKINILASQYGKTPPGFGELVYLPASGWPWFADGPAYTVNMIAARADSLLTRWDGITYQEYTDMNTILEQLNSSFAGNVPFTMFDTASWFNGAKLRLFGAKALSEVPFLMKVSGMVPKIIPDRAVDESLPQALTVEQNYPNPFNPTTTVQFSLVEPSFVTLTVYNILGQRVATLLDRQTMDEGEQAVNFNAANLPSGVYFYRIVAQPVSGAQANAFQATRRMLLLK